MENEYNTIESKKRTPSRAECETIIKKILKTETESRTVNATFKKPADFMNFFESLYPPSAALTKQVQRAIKSLNMAKDKNGYYILNKSKEQSNQDNNIKSLLMEADYSVDSLDNAQNVFLQLKGEYVDFVIHKIADSITLQPYIVTMIPCYNGIMIVTNNKEELLSLLNNLSL